MKKKMAAFLALFGMVWLAACTGGGQADGTERESEDKITLHVWHQWTNDTNELKKLYDNAVERYMSEHENLVIQTHTLDTEAYKTKISAEFAGAADGIDVFYYWGASTARKLVEADKLLPLDDYITEEIREQILPESEAAFQYNGKTYSLPSFSWYLTLFCNRDIFEEAGASIPSTYTELLDAVGQINDLGAVTPIAAGAKDGWNLALIYQALAMREVGAQNVNRMLNGEILFEDAGYREGAEKLVELYNQNAFGKNPLDSGNDEANRMFVKGDAAMRIMGSWFANQIYTDEAASINPDHVVAVGIPMIEGKGNESDYCGGFVESFWVNKSTAYESEAAEFAIYINEAIGNAAYESGSGFSGWKTRQEKKELNPLFVQIEKLLLDGRTGVLAWDTSLDPHAAAVHNDLVQFLCTPDADIDSFIEKHKKVINVK